MRLTISSLALLSEIYQVTGPVERFAGQIASQGYVVGQQWLSRLLSTRLSARAACPSVYHEFEGPEAIPYDVEGMSFPDRYRHTNI
jgi:carboxymethylenebutenolidase